MNSCPDRCVYVIMPVGSDPLYPEKRSALEESAPVDSKLHFPTYNNNQQHFNIDEIINDMKLADFVIADLSGARPSCYYELGIAHSLGKKTFLVAKAGTEIHQTLYRDQVSMYNDIISLRSILMEIFHEKI